MYGTGAQKLLCDDLEGVMRGGSEAGEEASWEGNPM